jgi:peptide/nickel transport system permease protein
MLNYVLRRLLHMIPVMLIVSLVSFAIMRFVPGDPALLIAGSEASDVQVEALREQLGLNKPILQQLVDWYAGVFRGDLGQSILLGRSVTEAMLERLPVSGSLALYALLLTIAFGLAGGLIAALRNNTWIDQVCMTVALLGVSIPNFWLGLMLIIVFSVHLGWLPTGGYVPFTEDAVGWLQSATLPAVSLALMQVGLLARMTRSTMLETLGQDYVRTAQAKGLPEWIVVSKHALANVMIPIVTVIGIIFSLLVSGAVVIESVFSIPGVGRLVANGILRRDYPLIQGSLLITTAILLLINLMVDILYAYLDPRVRHGR